MKELSIEEKAKAYDKAIEEAKSAHKDYKKQLDGIDKKSNAALIINGAISALEILFPELKESEDERIRKRIIALVNAHGQGMYKDEMLAWLEKQGNKDEKMLVIKDHIDAIKALKETHKIELEKQGENNMGISEATKQELEDNVHKALEKETPESWNKFLDEQGEQKPEKVDNLHNYLYGEQKSAWNKEDDYVIERLFCLLHNEQDKYPQQSSEFKELEEIENKLKSFKDIVQSKQEWKQENTGDLTDFENAMMHIGGSFFGDNAGLDPNDTNAIKEQANLLLELVPKQEWSEEDEKILGDIITSMTNLKDSATSDALRDIYNSKIDWLKSLRPQNTWKPSEEEMVALEHAINCYSGIAPTNTNEVFILEIMKERLKNLTK